MSNEKFAQLSYNTSYWLYLGSNAKESKVCFSYAYISHTCSSCFHLCPAQHGVKPMKHTEYFKENFFCCLESFSISIQISHITGHLVAVSILLQWEYLPEM